MKRVVLTSCCVYTNEIDSFLSAAAPVTHSSIIKYIEDRRTICFQVSRSEFNQLKNVIETYDLASRDDMSQGLDGFVTCREVCQFTNEEMAQAELFAVIDRAKPCDRDEWEHPVQFDYSLKGTEELPLPWGWQIEPLKILKSNLPSQKRPLWDTLHFEWGVSLAFKDAVAQTPFASDLGFRTITNPRGKSYDNVFQLAGKHQLPEYEPETTGLGPSQWVTVGDRKFLVEGGGLLEEGFSPVMDRGRILDVFGGIPEWSFAQGLIGDFDFVEDKPEKTGPTPRPIVGQAARQLLVSLGGRKLEFVPVTWKNASVR